VKHLTVSNWIQTVFLMTVLSLCDGWQSISGSTGFCGHVFLGIYELTMNSEAVPEKLLKTFQSFRSLKILGLSHNKHCAHWQNHKIR